MESEVGIRIGLSLLNNLNELAVDHREEVDSSAERNMGGPRERNFILYRVQSMSVTVKEVFVLMPTSSVPIFRTDLRST
jgi:hypothetical protein